MPDNTPLSDAELEAIEIKVRGNADTLRRIVMLLAADQPEAALAILGVVAGDLLDRVSPELRAEWLASFEPPDA